MKPFQPIAIAASTGELVEDARSLARELGAPLTELNDRHYAQMLVLMPERLELRSQGTRLGSVYADFVNGRMAYRRRFGGGRHQSLARAVGLRGSYRPSVLDGTAGLGRDAFVLAALGCRLSLVERSPVIAALLRNGLERAATNPEIGIWVRDRLQLVVSDSLGFMAQLPQAARPDVVYLDPMYPPRTKSALVKKELRVLRALVGDDHDAPLLLAAALRCARKRVVVKRPRLAPSLEGPAVSFSHESKTTRFDIYINSSAETAQ